MRRSGRMGAVVLLLGLRSDRGPAFVIASTVVFSVRSIALRLGVRTVGSGGGDFGIVVRHFSVSSFLILFLNGGGFAL